ncbi:VOC family protein (plasmid) [Streptomyces sp. CA-294286]|uniref:VOC family protein n=1 Tax=Streptomyces sp. CA-294286 TaxID=3240070 RepID=UPI003D8C85A1
MPNHISLIDFTVKDPQSARTFYTGVFDLELKMEMPDYPLFSSADGPDIGLIRDGADKGGPADGVNTIGSPTTVFTVDDIDATLAKVNSLGGKTVLTKTEITPEIGHYAYFADPDGNCIGLTQKP